MKKQRKKRENQRMNKCKCFTHPPAFYLHHLKQWSCLCSRAKEEWGWVGFQPGPGKGPGKGLMTHVWTNGSQWSYLLIQPQYFRSIKYVCLDRSLPPSSSSSPPPRSPPPHHPPDMETWRAACIYLWQWNAHWEPVRNDPTKKLNRKREDKGLVTMKHPQK